MPTDIDENTKTVVYREMRNPFSLNFIGTKLGIIAIKRVSASAPELRWCPISLTNPFQPAGI